MKRRNFKIILIIISLSILPIYGGLNLLYYLSIKEEIHGRRKYKIENDKLKGEITSIELDNKNKLKLYFRINDVYWGNSTYGPVCMSDSFIKSISKGDSVTKRKGEDYLTFSTKNGQKLKVKLDFCDY